MFYYWLTDSFTLYACIHSVGLSVSWSIYSLLGWFSYIFIYIRFYGDWKIQKTILGLKCKKLWASICDYSY